jgi:hypothetical protein
MPTGSCQAQEKPCKTPDTLQVLVFSDTTCILAEQAGRAHYVHHDADELQRWGHVVSAPEFPGDLCTA